MTIVSGFTGQATTTGAIGGTVRWMAPELLVPEECGLSHCSPSKQSDMYALGMVIYEVRRHEIKPVGSRTDPNLLH